MLRRAVVLGLACASGSFAQKWDEIRVEKLAAGYVYTEGPAWSPDGYLIWSDVPANQIQRWVPGQKPGVARENTAGASGNAYDAKGNLYTCETRGRRVVRIDKKGVVELLADKWEGKRLNAPNDIVVRKDGHSYFTDPAFGNQTAARELDFYGIYHLPPKGPLEIVAKPKGRPNGVALSPNGKILYVTNSDERAVYAYDLDNKGAATRERKLISGIAGAPDGIRADEKGNLYIAATGVAIYSPEGKLVHTIEISETPRNLAFGEPDYQTLFITALSSVYRVRLDVKGAVQY
ncbi:MAG: SMP-30/gluconolactonase/LRE family protein [Acidobacteria bacterium]|nr:SMP-30/gluconolactonase/LRE family protein [Acidobacteriota bacterium]